MQNTGLTASDVALMTRDNDNFLEGNGIIILILFFLIFGFGGNGFGGSNQVTNDFLFNNLANQNREIMAGVNATDRDVLTSSCNTQKEILESRYTTQLGFQNTNSQMAQCCLRIIKKVQTIVGNHTRNSMLAYNY